MFRNTKATLIALTAVMAFMIIGSGNMATAGNEVMKYDPSANTKVKSYDPQVRAFEPQLSACDPQVQAHSKSLSSDTSAVLRQFENVTGLDKSIKHALDFFRNIMQDNGKKADLWKIKILTLKKLGL